MSQRATATLNLRRFLFHTLLASGAPALSPTRGLCMLCRELAVFATSLGRAAAGCDGALSGLGLSPGLDAATVGEGEAAFARKFFVTDTLLKVAGFFTELVRM